MSRCSYHIYIILVCSYALVRETLIVVIIVFVQGCNDLRQAAAKIRQAVDGTTKIACL